MDKLSGGFSVFTRAASPFEALLCLLHFISLCLTLATEEVAEQGSSKLV